MARIKEDVVALAKVSRNDQMTRVATLRSAMIVDAAVSFMYDGKARVVEVHALGLSSKDGGLLMRGYQTAGQSSRPLPVWTLFRIDGIEALGHTFTESQAPREGFRAEDKQMAPVLCELVA